MQSESQADAKYQGHWGKREEQSDSQHDDRSAPAKPKQEPNFAPSGKLSKANETQADGARDGQGQRAPVKYSEPPDSRMPDKKWRLFVFKGEEQLEPILIHKQTHYLFGRDREVAHIPTDHPSCSKQHAVLQFRQKEAMTLDGRVAIMIKPYLIDLESANGSFINGQKMDAAKYYELLEKDVIKFGFSTREYVLLHDESTEKTPPKPELVPFA